ncbi:hypothetical protein EDC94DRAFT_586327 [Helicostylum pulchrum]|nr:hypothetical protein EDC94DRAFT_586327 [Helicostylum pulchrum]
MSEITNTEHITKRHRRHTIARPASALALISDSSASEDEDGEDHDQFDRISDILSNLIQEANEAVNYEKATTITSIPLVRKLSSSTVESVQRKRLHKTSRPVSYPSSSSLISVRRRSSATIVPRPSVTNLSTRTTVVKRQKSGDEITESFKRLDSSLAMIDSLSRDLVPEKVTWEITKKPMISTPFDSRLSALLLLPLLHVPHALISMVFDTIASPDNNIGNNNTLGGMVVWAFIFAITNLVVDKAVNTPKNPMSTTKLLPGTFDQQQIKTIQNKKRPKMYKKRNSRQQQLYFQQQQQQQSQPQQQPPIHLLERKSILLRRNSL